MIHSKDEPGNCVVEQMYGSRNGNVLCSAFLLFVATVRLHNSYLLSGHDELENTVLPVPVPSL